jgi:hypothetical protein
VDWLEQVVPTIMVVDVNMKSRAIVDTVNLHYQHRTNIQQAQCVKKKLLSLSIERLIIATTETILIYKLSLWSQDAAPEVELQ